jgi:hypothetical protein
MSDPTQNLGLTARTTQTGQAMARLAKDETIFRGAVDAFRAGDADSFLRLLDRVKARPYCEEICRWFASKECVLECLELCGPPKVDLTIEQIAAATAEIVRISANEELVERLADVVERRDQKDFKAFIEQQKLQNYCRIICHWVCTIRFGLICEILCGPILEVPERNLVTQLSLSGKAIAPLAKDSAQLRQVIDAAIRLNCEYLQDVAVRFENCHLVCRWICSWRSVFVCGPICRPLEIPKNYIDEMRAFAEVSGRLANEKDAYSRLLASVEAADGKAFSALVQQYKIEAYCLQLCHWMSYQVCHRFCICVCPPPELIPQFTQIGLLPYATKIDSVLPATGLTVGGAEAFYSTLRLNGVLPQTLGGQPLEYAFEYIPVKIASTTLATAIAPGDITVKVTSSAGFPAAPFNVVIGGASGGYEIMTVTAVASVTWTVTRGQQGTTAAAAAVGATIVTGTTTTGSWTQVPQTMIKNIQIGTLEIFVPTPIPHYVFEPVYVNPLAGELFFASFTADGWIQVPQGSNFSPNGNMINLDTTQLAAFAASDQTGVAAGTTAINLPTDLYFGIRMRVRQAGSSTSSDGGTCSVVAIDNTLYNNVNHHPDWAGYVSSGAVGVAMVDIKELQAAGCAGLHGSLTILFTASHPNLTGVSITMTGPGGPYNFTLPTPINQTGNWYGTAIPPGGFVFTNLTPCAYIVTLSITFLLTNGDGSNPGPLTDQIAFCLK